MIPLKTAIADDDRYICQQIQECLMQYSTQKDIDIDDPDIYTDCATLYNTDFTQKRYDLVFMDIDFSGGTEPVKHFSLFDTTRERCDNGIALGAHLRNRLGHNYFDIIYVTSFENYAIHTIPNRPAALVQKPVTYEKISNALDDALYYRDISWRVFEFTCNNSPVHVQVSKIRYLNSSICKPMRPPSAFTESSARYKKSHVLRTLSLFTNPTSSTRTISTTFPQTRYTCRERQANSSPSAGLISRWLKSG